MPWEVALSSLVSLNQSAQPSFLIADLSYDADLLKDVRNVIEAIFLKDPKLQSENGQRLRNLLYLFEKDVAIQTLQAG